MREPVGEDPAHQFVRQVFAAVEDRAGEFSEVGAVFDLLAEQRAGAEIAQAETFGQFPALSALPGRWRTEHDQAESSGGGTGQWTELL
jgi:hypothetical protein